MIKYACKSNIYVVMLTVQLSGNVRHLLMIYYVCYIFIFTQSILSYSLGSQSHMVPGADMQSIESCIVLNKCTF